MGDARDLKDKEALGKSNGASSTAEKFLQELRDSSRTKSDDKRDGGGQNSKADENKPKDGDRAEPKPVENLEPIKPWELLTEAEQANFRILKTATLRLLPYMKADVLVGETEQKLQNDVTALLNKEKDPERRKALQSLLEPKEGLDRKKVLADLLKGEKDPESKKVLQALIDGEKGRNDLSDLLQKVEAGDYEATMKLYTRAVQYLQKNVTQTVVDLANMQIGDRPDPT